MAKKNNTTIEDTTIDKEKIEKEIKKEVKEVLLGDLEKQVEVFVQSKIEKLEKKIYKQKQRALFKKNIVILILLILVIFEGKILYDNGLLNNTKVSGNIGDYTDVKKEENDGDVVSEDIKDEEWYINEYSYLLDNINTSLVGDDFTYLYNDDYNIKDISNEVKLNMAYQLIDKDSIDKKDGFIMLDSSVLEEQYKSIFGKKIDFKNEDFTSDCIHFIYNKDLDKYLAVELDCAVNDKEIKEEILSIREEDGKIIISTILGIYNSKDKTINNLDDSFSKKFKDNLKDYEKDLDSYEYTFIKEEDNYYFKSIKRR